MNKFSVALFLVLCLAQYNLWFGKNGLQDYQRVSSELAKQKTQNEQLKLRNSQLFAEIADLTSGYDAVEERARSELSMIKQGEEFYRVVTK